MLNFSYNFTFYYYRISYCENPLVLHLLFFIIFCFFFICISVTFDIHICLGIMFCCTPGAENQEGADFGGMEVERIPVRIACAMGITIVAAVVAAVSRLTLLTLRLMKCALCSAANSLGTPKPPAQAQAPTQHDTPPTPYFPGISPFRFPGTGIIEYVFISRFLSFLDYFSSAFSLF